MSEVTVVLIKPKVPSDLALPFQVIGEAGWAEALSGRLSEYGLELPRPVSLDDIHSVEARIGVRLPKEWRLMLLEFGPPDLESVRFLDQDSIRPTTDLWFSQLLSPAEQTHLGSYLYIAETGSDNFFVFDIENRAIRLIEHDPAGIHEWIPSVTALLQFAYSQLPAGQYGWPDSEVQALVQAHGQALLDQWWQGRPDA